jgi:hypothetical protein
MHQPPKKVEIINIDLGLDLGSEIRAKQNEVAQDIKIYTNGLLKQGELKRQNANKKKAVQAQKDEHTAKAIKLLVDAYVTEDPWVTSEPLLKAAETESLSQLIQRIKNYLKRDDLWTILKTKRRGETVYSLQKFGRLD